MTERDTLAAENARLRAGLEQIVYILLDRQYVSAQKVNAIGSVIIDTVGNESLSEWLANREAP